MATFVFKVFTLAIRTASKPLATRFQTYVLAHPTMRPAVLKFAQGVHNLDFKLSKLAEGKSLSASQKFVAALDDERAMDLAGKVVSEGFVLAVGVGVLYWDYRRGAKKDEKKAERDKEYKAAVDQKFNAMLQSQQQMQNSNEAMFTALLSRQETTEYILKSIQEAELQRRQKSWISWGKA